MSTLAAGSAVDAHALDLAHAPLPAAEVVAGTPTTGSFTLSTLGSLPDHGVEVGIWEMTPGTASDIEADELFVVLSGRAVVSFVAPALPDLAVGPGSIVRLVEGMQTVWTVTETLRKVYVA